MGSFKFDDRELKKFMKDLEKTTMKEVKSEVLKGKYDIECPHCGANISVPVGKSFCSHCRNEVELTLDFR